MENFIFCAVAHKMFREEYQKQYVRMNVQKQSPELFCKKGDLKNSAIFTEKYFLTKLQAST